MFLAVLLLFSVLITQTISTFILSIVVNGLQNVVLHSIVNLVMYILNLVMCVRYFVIYLDTL